MEVPLSRWYRGSLTTGGGEIQDQLGQCYLRPEKVGEKWGGRNGTTYPIAQSCVALVVLLLAAVVDCQLGNSR